MEPTHADALAELRAALSPWVGLGSLGLIVIAALAAFVVTQLMASGALWSFRGVPHDAHWTERARRGWPVRVVGSLGPWVVSMILGVLVARAVGPLSLVPGNVVGVLAAVSAFFASMPATIRSARRVGRPAVPLGRDLRGLACMLLVQSPVVIVVLFAAALTPCDAAGALATTCVVVALMFATLRGWNVRLAARLGLVRPADARLAAIVEQTSARVGVHASRVWIAEVELVNAFAFPRLGELLFTSQACRELDDAQLAAITAHELGHLGEPRSVVRVRSLGVFLLLPLVWLRPAASVALGGTSLFPIVVMLTVIAMLAAFQLIQRTTRRMEERADAVAHAHEEDAGSYARALERVHELNLIPAVTPAKRAVHPHLYDRLLAAGVTPSYPRPAPPSTLPTQLSVLAGAVLLGASWIGMRAVLDEVVFASDEPPMWIVALRTGDPYDLGELAYVRSERGDARGALTLYRALSEIEPGEPEWYASRAQLAAELGECDEASWSYEAGFVRSRAREDETHAVLQTAEAAIEACWAAQPEDP